VPPPPQQSEAQSAVGAQVPVSPAPAEWLAGQDVQHDSPLQHPKLPPQPSPGPLHAGGGGGEVHVVPLQTSPVLQLFPRQQAWPASPQGGDPQIPLVHTRLPLQLPPAQQICAKLPQGGGVPQMLLVHTKLPLQLPAQQAWPASPQGPGHVASSWHESTSGRHPAGECTI